MPLRAIARLIQTMLYGRRFFPYYVYNILGGIEEDGELPFLFSPPLLDLNNLLNFPAYLLSLAPACRHGSRVLF